VDAPNSKLTRDTVNEAIRRHLSYRDLQVVVITKDAAGLRDALVSNAPATIAYDARKPEDVLAEDREVGAYRLGLGLEDVVITPVERCA
jgi:zinc protease